MLLLLETLDRKFKESYSLLGHADYISYYIISEHAQIATIRKDLPFVESLLDFICFKGQNGLPVGVVIHLFNQLVEIVKTMHTYELVHLGLALEHIWIDSMSMTVFLKKIVPSVLSIRGPCKLHYMSPELLTRRSEDTVDGCAANVWALGIILFLLTTGHFPFDGQTKKELLDDINCGLFFTAGEFSSELKAFIAELLSPDPLERMTIKDIQENAFYQTTLRSYMH